MRSNDRLRPIEDIAAALKRTTTYASSRSVEQQRRAPNLEIALCSRRTASPMRVLCDAGAGARSVGDVRDLHSAKN